MNSELSLAQEIAYAPNRLYISNAAPEAESQDYGAWQFDIGSKRALFRVAKITPTKIGQFVTLWKRIGKGPILPYDISDPIDIAIISVRKGALFGQFIFPKEVLCEQGIISKEGSEGKRAMRIYPPWDLPDSRQAKKTQAWQSLYFLDLSYLDNIDHERLKTLID